MKSGPFARDRRRDRRIGLPRVGRDWPRAALAGALVATAAVTLSACGGGSGASLGPASLAANRAAASNGATGAAGSASASATATTTVPTTAGSVATSSGTSATVSGGATAGGAATAGGSGSAAGSTTTVITGGTLITGTRTGISSGLPAAPAAPSAGSSNATEPPSSLPAAVQAVSCPLPGPQSQAIPAGFEPIAAVRCVPTPGQPTTLTMEVATSSLAPLLAALLEPSSPPSSVNSVPWCVPPAVDTFPLALVGANGQVIEPSIPVSFCGRPIPAVVASLAALSWTTVS